METPSCQLTKLITSIDGISGSFNDVSGKRAQLTHSIREITVITGSLNDIEEQTKLLALNATIEAARAGESGEGLR